MIDCHLFYFVYGSLPPTASGYRALFVSVDLPVIGSRRNERRNKFAFPDHLEFPCFKGATDNLMETYAAGYGMPLQSLGTEYLP